MRVFTALEITPEGQHLLSAQTEPLRKAFPRLKWVARESLHVTLSFFGELSDERVKRVVSLFEAAKVSLPAFPLTVRGIGVFPRKGPARVVFAEIKEGQQECSTLFLEESEIFREIIPRQRTEYTPHITLARVRKGVRWPSPGKNRTVPAGKLYIDRIVLYQSILDRTGASYVKLAEKKLKTP